MSAAFHSREGRPLGFEPGNGCVLPGIGQMPPDYELAANRVYQAKFPGSNRSPEELKVF